MVVFSLYVMYCFKRWIESDSVLWGELTICFDKFRLQKRLQRIKCQIFLAVCMPRKNHLKSCDFNCHFNVFIGVIRRKALEQRTRKTTKPFKVWLIKDVELLSYLLMAFVRSVAELSLSWENDCLCGTGGDKMNSFNAVEFFSILWIALINLWLQFVLTRWSFYSKNHVALFTQA